MYPKLWPGSFYTSPLRRCITTAVAISNAAHRKGHMESKEPHIHVVDNFREWLGWNHNQQNDTRSTRTDIEDHAATSMGIELSFPLAFPETDEMFLQSPLEETWVQVDQRWEETLRFIFETDSNKVICISGHNRCIQSGFRTMGYAVDDETLRHNFGIMNMRNGAMVAFLVRRCRLDATEVEAIRAQRATLRKKEELIIRQAKDSDDKDADKELQNMTLVEMKRLLELLHPLAQQAVHSLRQQKENPEPTKGFTLGKQGEIPFWS